MTMIKRQIKTFKLFTESYEDIMDNITNDVDVKKITDAESEIVKMKDAISKKRDELEVNLQKLEDLQIDSLSEENKKKVIKTREMIQNTIDKLKIEIQKQEADIKIFKDKIESFKK